MNINMCYTDTYAWACIRNKEIEEWNGSVPDSKIYTNKNLL